VSAPANWERSITDVGLLCDAQVSHPDAEYALAHFDGEPMVSVALAIHPPDPDHEGRFLDHHIFVGLMMTTAQADGLARVTLSMIDCASRCIRRQQN